jgi:hypothetical protein
VSDLFRVAGQDAGGRVHLPPLRPRGNCLIWRWRPAS